MVIQTPVDTKQCCNSCCNFWVRICYWASHSELDQGIFTVTGIVNFENCMKCAIGVARGALGARTPPGRRKNFFWAKFTRESCKCTHQAESAPPRQSKSRFFLGNWGIWTVGEVIQVVLACVLRATTTFLEKKSAPQTKSWLRHMKYARICHFGAKEINNFRKKGSS